MTDWQQYEAYDAISIALAAGVLRKCEYHEMLMPTGRSIEAAYKLGNALFTAGRRGFYGRREMTDAIKQAVENNSSDECYFCERWLDD